MRGDGGTAEASIIVDLLDKDISGRIVDTKGNIFQIASIKDRSGTETCKNTAFQYFGNWECVEQVA